MIITGKEIRERFERDEDFKYLIIFDKLGFKDTNYFVPAKSWWIDEFFPWFKLQLQHYRVWNYHSSWDCDNFAEAFKVFANICHAQTKPKKTDAVAVSEFHFLPDMALSPHAINYVMIDTKNGIEFRAVEPQVPKMYTLSKTEKASNNFNWW